MKFTIERYPQGLKNLAILTGLNEPIDNDCEFVVARNGSIAGVAGVNFNKEVYPRFEHIIVAPQYQKTSLAGRLMLKMEKLLKDKGFWHYVSFIYHGNPIHKYALKFGMKPFGNRPKGVWYYKEVKC